MKNKRGQLLVKRLLLIQFAINLAITAIFGLIRGGQDALSAFLGGVVAIVPTLLFARKLFYYQGARAARQIVKSFYVGEAIKLLSTMLLFAAVFIFFKVKPFAFFLSYIVVLMNQWIASVILDNKQNRPESD